MLAIIDGDVLAYQACRSRWAQKAKIEDGVAFVSLDDDGKRVPLEYTVEEDRAYMEESWENFKSDLKGIVEANFCTDFLMAVKGSGNFRNDMYPEYKMNRHKSDPGRIGLFVPSIRKLAVHEGLAVAADGMEADDLVRIWATQAMEAGREYIVCSIDKDLRCIPGRHYYMKRDAERHFEVTTEEARRHYYEQMLKGDMTDNVPGVPRVGEVKARRFLAGCRTDEEFQEVVVEQYMKAYEEAWYEALLMNGRMIHLLRWPGDYFNPRANWPVVTDILEAGQNNTEV